MQKKKRFQKIARLAKASAAIFIGSYIIVYAVSLPTVKCETEPVAVMAETTQTVIESAVNVSDIETIEDIKSEEQTDIHVEAGEEQQDSLTAKKRAELNARIKRLENYENKKHLGSRYKRKGFVFTKEMYMELSGQSDVPEDWMDQMDFLLDKIMTENNEFSQTEGTDDGAMDLRWEPVNALDAELYSMAMSSTESLPAALEAVRAAQKRLGYPYSQPRRDSGIAYDCSSLVYWAYLDAGINVDPVGCHTAANIAQYLEEQGKQVDGGELKPGDIIFYSYEQNGRYKDISHVSIYSGNGQMVHASSTLGHVVTTATDLNRAVSIARPVWDDGDVSDAEAEITETEEVLATESHPDKKNVYIVSPDPDAVVIPVEPTLLDNQSGESETTGASEPATDEDITSEETIKIPNGVLEDYELELDVIPGSEATLIPVGITQGNLESEMLHK